MKTFESIKLKLVDRNVPFEEVTFTDVAVSARTEDTSVDKNYNPKDSIKTLVISTKDGFKAVILMGSDRIDQVKLKEIVGKWSVVDFRTLEEKFDFNPGCVCPLDLELPFLIDEAAANMQLWSMGAGENNKGFNVQKEDALKVLQNFKIVSIA